MKLDTKSEQLQFALMVLAIIADIALIINIIHHW